MNILVVDIERTMANHLADILHQTGHNPLPLYSLQDAVEHTKPPRRFQSGQFYFDVAILCTIGPYPQALEFADTLKDFIPRCKIVIADFCEDVDFWRSRRSDFTYLDLPLNVEDFLGTIGGLNVRVAQEKIQIEQEIEAFWDSLGIR